MSTPPQGPAGQYGQPEPVYHQAPDAPTEEPRKGGTSRGLVIGGIGLGTALILGGGAYAVVNGLSGGGDQPADVLPGDAVAYARLDIDPSAGQKIASVRFMDKLPAEAREVLDSQDWRAEFFSMIESQGGLGDLTYEDDIEPWLGDRVGVTVSPGPDGPDGDPLIAFALQVSDQDAAESFFSELPDNEGAEWYVNGDYLVITEEGSLDAVQSATESGSLADSENFSADMDALGDDGIASFWLDTPGLANVVQPEDLLGMGGMAGMTDPTGMGLPEGASTESPFGDPEELLAQSGRVAATLRFESDYVELHGISRDAQNGIETSGEPNIAATFPADTLAVFGFSGGENLVTEYYDLIQQMDPEMLAEAEGQLSQLGMTLPEDAQVLLGRSFGIGVDSSIMNSVMSGSPNPEDIAVGLKVDTSDPARFQELLDQFMTMGGEGAPALQQQVDGDVVSVALNESYLGALTGGETLADDDAFNLAVNNAQDADALFYLDLRPIAPLLGSMGGGQGTEVLGGIAGIGMSSTQTSDTEAEFTFRVTATND